MKLPPLYHLWDEGQKLEDYHARDIYLVGIQAFAKAYDVSPCEFANEYVCGLLAQAIRLPVAQGVFVNRKGEAHYASFNSYVSKMIGPRCIPPHAKEIVANLPVLACGIVVFDVWIHNKDRHPGNVGYDRDRDSVHIFDHGEAFMRDPDVPNYLRSNIGTVFLGDHCISPYIDANALGYMNEWIEKIAAIPESFIRTILQEAMDYGIDDTMAQAGEEFLLRRRDNLHNLITGNQSCFPSAKSLFAEGG